MAGESVAELIEASDLDGLVRLIGTLVAAGDWNAIDDLMERCEEAVERGKQVWGAREYAEYRIALDAPAELAARVLHIGAGRFAAGPLWEVAASTHTWADLAPHVADPRLLASIAQERALRGESIPDGIVPEGMVEIPLQTQTWEPRYPVATYREDGVDVPGPDLPELQWVDLGEPGTRIDDRDACEALLDVVRPWLEESSGRGEAVAVEGTAEGGIRALGPHRVRLADIDLETALQMMAWSGASGGAYGRRRGAPAGRVAAWWALTVLLSLQDEWPPDPEVLRAGGSAMRWVAWDPGDRTGGWALHLAIEDPAEGRAWVVTAADAV